MTTLINTALNNTASLSPSRISGKTIWGNSIKTSPVAAPIRTMRHLALKWDLYAVVTLMAACTGYGAFVLGQV